MRAFRALAVMLPCLLSAAWADCKLERYAELPVTMAGTRPMIAGSVNGNDARFIADSGAFFSTLTREAAERFKLRWQSMPPWINVRGVKGGDLNIRLGSAKDFSLVGFDAGALIHGVDFLVGGNSFGDGAAGVIGQNVIGRNDTEYDFGNGAIRLIRSKDCGAHALAYWAAGTDISVIKIHEVTPAEPHLVGEATLNGAKIAVLFDTGAAQSVLSFRGARRAGVKLDGPEVQPGGASQGLSSEAFQTWITRFDSLDIGGEQIRNARLRIADVELPGGADLLLGADFFLSHRIYVATNQLRIYFTYNGGHVFDLRQPTTDVAQQPASAEPTDAAALLRRGAALVGRGEIANGIADFDRAIALDPTDPGIYGQRGMARWRSGDSTQALGDFNRALQLNPDEVPILVERGSLKMAQSDGAGARADFDRAEMLAPHDATVSLEIAEVYARDRRFDEALPRFDQWASAYPRDDRIGHVLGERCWIRAFSGDSPDQALVDCNGAIRNGQRVAHAFEGRGLVWLRLRNYDKAMSDFKDCLHLEPRNAYALYGLGVAESRRGLQTAGDDDIKAAVALRSSVGEDFKRIGIAP